MRALFTFPTLPRHPLLRVLALAGIALVLVGLLTLGLVVGAAALAVAATALAVRRWRARRTTRTSDPAIIEGEFKVVPPRARVNLP
ncbi:MAG TPA: hypothetical protein VFY97_08050, partial [Rhodanobacteraceae bacterium]|nr:hypothetical protein [Rhodanobacteraceae bacterium]